MAAPPLDERDPRHLEVFQACRRGMLLDELVLLHQDRRRKKRAWLLGDLGARTLRRRASGTEQTQRRQLRQTLCIRLGIHSSSSFLCRLLLRAEPCSEAWRFRYGGASEDVRMVRTATPEVQPVGHSPRAQNAEPILSPPYRLAYPVPIPDLTTQGAGKSWLSAIGSGGHDRARDISESVPCLLPAITYAGSPPGVDDRGLAAGGPVVVRGAASAASPNYNGTALAAPPLRGTLTMTQSLGSDGPRGVSVLVRPVIRSGDDRSPTDAHPRMSH